MVCSKRGDDMADLHHMTHQLPVARIQARRHATKQHGSASPKSPQTEDPQCWGVKPSELGLNTSHCAASL